VFPTLIYIFSVVVGFPHSVYHIRVDLSPIHLKHVTPCNIVVDSSQMTSTRLIWSLGNRFRCQMNLGPLHTRYSEPVTSTLQALSLVEMAPLVQVRFTLRLSMMGSCFMVAWNVSENYLLEVGLTQNHWEIMALRTLTTV
jgi:hypothetical protein